MRHIHCQGKSEDQEKHRQREKAVLDSRDEHGREWNYLRTCKGAIGGGRLSLSRCESRAGGGENRGRDEVGVEKSQVTR